MGRMKTEDIIYRVLEALDKSLDEDKPDFKDLTPDVLGISRERRDYILEMMQDAGLIKDVSFPKGGNGRAPLMAMMDHMNITLRGVMFLAENSTTSKVIKAAKLLKDVIPGI